MRSSRRPSREGFPSLGAEKERASRLFGIDAEESFNAWMTDMLGEDGADRIRRRQATFNLVSDTMPDLTAREKEILSLAACGYTKPQIAERLYLSHETVKSHLKHVYAKLRAKTMLHAVIIAGCCGELDTEVVEAHLWREWESPRLAAPGRPVAA